MYHVALIDITNKAIALAEEYKAKAARDRRAGHLSLQAEMNEGGLNPDVPKGTEWCVVTGEIPFAFPTPAEEAAALEASVRSQRDGLLAASDWTQTAVDSPLSDKQRQAWADYRQRLRDLPEQDGFPEEIDWPVAPGA